MTSLSVTDTTMDDSRKIFVGNLSFNVTNEMLSAYFSVCGKVESAKVITRGRRSLGYGFVTFSKEEEAVEAHKKFNHQTFENREINVELAKPKEQSDLKTRSKNSGRLKGVSNRPRRVGGPRQRNAKENTTSSPLSLFVANLPYKMDDEAFLQIFSDYAIESAHIITTRNGHSRGYGFVKFLTESEQKRALENLQDCEINNRPIVVRAAFEPKKPAQSKASPVQVSA